MKKNNKYMSDTYENFFDNDLSTSDPELYNSVKLELKRQQEHIELIASENIVSKSVLDAQGSVLTNKYAEGYPSKRYYGGCEFVDIAENLALERVKKLFQCNYANVQPHSGAQANGAVYLALLNPGDTILGMSLNSGGHLTHGAKVALSGKWFDACHYEVDKKTGLINYEDIEKIASSNIISVSQLDDISLFRSSAGHDASDDFENCRSMKHYLEPTQKSNQINSVYAPVSGTIVSMDTEEGGGFVDDNLTNQRVGIKSSSNSAYEITLYHVDLLPELNLALGDEVTAGELLGYGRLVRVNSDDPDGTIADASNDFDISVGIATMEGTANISFFNIVSDNVFNEFFD
mgnify:CR=1 FL=1